MKTSHEQKFSGKMSVKNISSLNKFKTFPQGKMSVKKPEVSFK